MDTENQSDEWDGPIWKLLLEHIHVDTLYYLYLRNKLKIRINKGLPEHLLVSTVYLKTYGQKWHYLLGLYKIKINLNLLKYLKNQWRIGGLKSSFKMVFFI